MTLGRRRIIISLKLSLLVIPAGAEGAEISYIQPNNGSNEVKRAFFHAALPSAA